MTVKHIMADGKVLADISGHVVKEKDARCVYDLMERINQKELSKKRRGNKGGKH